MPLWGSLFASDWCSQNFRDLVSKIIKSVGLKICAKNCSLWFYSISVSHEKFCYFHFWPLWLSTEVETQSKQLKDPVTAQSRERKQMSALAGWCVREGSHSAQTQSISKTCQFPNMSWLNHFSPSLLQSCNLFIQHVYTEGLLCSRHCSSGWEYKTDNGMWTHVLVTLLAWASLCTTLLADWLRLPHLPSPSILHIGA